MTVSDKAKNRWFSCRNAIAILFCLNMFGSQTLHAQTVDNDTAQCHARKLLIGPSLWLGEQLNHYSIKAKSNPPSRILKPGETYQIRYNIETSCPFNCGKVRRHTLSHRAVLGADRIKIQTSSYVTTSTSTIVRFTCGDRHTRVLTFTVPSPKTLGAQGQEVETVTMGVCPPNTNSGSATDVARSGSLYGYNCAGHTIRVGSTSLSGWKVSVLKPLQRAIGQGVNRVPANQPLTLSATVTRTSGWPVAGQGPMIEIRQITSTAGPINTAPISPMPAPNLGAGASAQVRFTLRAHTPGVYSYKACLTGLKQDDWPAPDVCGPPTAITVGVPAAGAWKVGPVKVSGTPAHRKPFFLTTLVINQSSTHNPPGAKYLLIWLHNVGQPVSTDHLITRKQLGVFNANSSKSVSLPAVQLVAARYSFRACVADTLNASQVNSVCGPWNRIDIGSKAAHPPQPLAPVANTCTGGRSKNAQGRCVCPAGSFWNANPGFNRCYTCRSGTTWNKRAKRCIAPITNACTGGRVFDRSQGRCICEGDQFWNPGLKRCYQCTRGRNWNASQNRCVCPSGTKWNQRANRCGAAFQAVPTPQVRLPALGTQLAIRCSGGRVSNGACLCPRGFTRRTVKKNVYVCKAPVKRPAPGASQVRPKTSSSAFTLQNQLKKPATNKMRCIGGQVKGPLCWCGIGRFPKKIGNNAYRCQ